MRPESSVPDRHPDRYQIRIGGLALREHVPAVSADLAAYVVSAGSQRTAYAKLHKAAMKRAKWRQAETMSSLGWPEVRDEGPVNCAGATSVSFAAVWPRLSWAHSSAAPRSVRPTADGVRRQGSGTAASPHRRYAPSLSR